ncbi:MAG: glutamate synthase subunit alpha, partial [Dehalococcoidia bacterium]|nr:glutamate synthase subunit alpha [Dehalococcoidia bacterium]
MPNSHLTAAVQGVAASKSGSKPGASTASDHGYLVSAQDFHDACGTGFIAETTGTRSRRVVEMAIQAVDALTHRGAVNADPLTGDGSGITIQIPFELLQDTLQELGADVAAEDLAVGMIFLPHEESNRPRAREIFEEECRRAGVEVIGWRVVPTDASVLGPQALESLPGFEQLLLRRPADQQGPQFDRSLYLARRRAEHRLGVEELRDCYVVSMSSTTVVYKGMMIAPALADFYPDLKDDRVVSSIALYHQRFATNTLPSWELAQPFRMTAHNGEFNTLLGNRNWMLAREPELASPVWGDDVADLAPVIRPIGSDTASFDEVLELLVLSGRDLLHSVMMLIPQAWENMPNLDSSLRAFYEYHACLTEPWDGPAAIAVTNGVQVAAIMDRNGLRPARYQVTRDGLVVMGSEVGLVELAPADIAESGRLGPGEMIAVDTVRRQFLHNDEIKSEV